MTYNPRIYIDNYGITTYRLLADSKALVLTPNAANLQRGLIMKIDPAPALEFLLLSGDAQSGTDILSLSVIEAGDLLLTNQGAIRFFGRDVNMVFGTALSLSAGAFTFTGNSVNLILKTILKIDAGSLSFTGNAASFKRGLVLSATSKSFVFSGNAANLNYSGDLEHILLTGDQQSGIDRVLTTGDEQSGTDTILVTTAVPSNILLTGDAQSGIDTILTSGDEQSGTDKILISGI